MSTDTRGIAYDTGKSHWRYGDPCDGWHRLLGPCPVCGSPTFDYGGGWRCCELYCSNSAGNPTPNLGPAPEWWTDGTRVYLDGNAWCAVGPGFTNLQESPAGFGNTPHAAVRALKAAHDATGEG